MNTEPSAEALTFARKLAFATIKEIAYALDAFAAQAVTAAEAELVEWKGDKPSFCRNNPSDRCATILACHDQCMRFVSEEIVVKPAANDLERARQALRRGTPIGSPIKSCSCFSDVKAPRDCKSVCEDAAEWIAVAITEAVSAERERCAQIVELYPGALMTIQDLRAAIVKHIRAANDGASR